MCIPEIAFNIVVNLEIHLKNLDFIFQEALLYFLCY